MLGRWKREVEAQENGAFPGKGRLLSDQEEIYRLREENKRLRMEREILKKAAAFFANASTEGMPLWPSTRADGRYLSCVR